MQIPKRKNRLDVMVLGHCKEQLNMPSMPAPSRESTRFQSPIETLSPQYDQITRTPIDRIKTMKHRISATISRPKHSAPRFYVTLRFINSCTEELDSMSIVKISGDRGL